MVNKMPQKRFRYILVHPQGKIVLDDDPKGWDGHEVGFERSEDFGLNVQNVVPLSFFGAAGDKIKELYGSNGIFTKTSCHIEKRNDQWMYDVYYIYKHDYTTYKDNLRYIEISGLEDGLAKKFDTYKDTEYEIDLPSVGNKTFINYTGADYVTTNQLQCGYGKMIQFKNNDIFIPKGNLSVRAYNNKISFADSNMTPYENMTFRALTNITNLEVKVNLNIKVFADQRGSGVAAGKMKLFKRDGNMGVVFQTWTPTSSSYLGSGNIEDSFYRGMQTVTIPSLSAGDLVSLGYFPDNDEAYDSCEVKDGGDCYIEITEQVSSAYNNATLECFSYEWIISQLLLKIDPLATFTSNVSYDNIFEVITATPCIRSIGKNDIQGKVKTTLSDVLESFNKLKCISIDITGQKMTISNRFNSTNGAYRDQSYGTIKANKIVIEHDTKYQYNKVTVGADTDDREDDDPLIYPFICEKEYSVEDTTVDNELDLVNNFMIDPYQIDKYIIDTVGENDNKDDCDFAVIACGGVYSFTKSLGYKIYNFTVVNTSLEYYLPVSKRITMDIPGDKRGDSQSKIRFKAFFDKTNYSADYTIKLYSNGYLVQTWNNSNHPNDATFETTNFVKGKSSLKIEYTQEMKIPPSTNATSAYISILDITEVYQSLTISDRFLYKSHTISNFSGDAATIYNIPLTPQRILKRWEKFLALSVVGSPNKRLKFGTTKILKSGIKSRCDYETADVVENSDLNLATVTPAFLPATIAFDTSEEFFDIDTFQDEKYKYLTIVDEKTGNEYKGWINSVTLPIGKNKTKSIILQAKEL